MIWFLVLGGLALVVVGLVGLKPPRPYKRTPPIEQASTKPTTESEAWEILADPIIVYEPVSPNHRARDNRGFRRGLATGLGSGLLLWGLFLAVTPQQPPRLPIVNTAQTPGGSSPQTPVPLPAPTTPTTPPAVPANIDFEISPGELPDAVATRLAESGLVDDSNTFLGRMIERGVDTRLRTGTFTIQTGSSLDEVIDVLTT